MTHGGERFFTDVWHWRWNSQAPPPSGGQFRTDSRDWASAAVVSFSGTNSAGIDVLDDLLGIVVGSTLGISHGTDPSRNVQYVVGSVATTAAGVDVTVTNSVVQGTLPNSGTDCSVTFATDSGGPQDTWWIRMTATVPDPQQAGVIYAPGSTVQVTWPLDYLKELWLDGKAHQVDPPEWALP